MNVESSTHWQGPAQISPLPGALLDVLETCIFLPVCFKASFLPLDGKFQVNTYAMKPSFVPKTGLALLCSCPYSRPRLYTE